jgi:uncharacterized membrane protein
VAVMKKRLSFESLRASLWFWPMLTSAAAIAVTLALLNVRPTAGAFAWAFPGDAEGASTLVQVVGTSSMTAATLTFSLTVVALQLASQQFSPRLLREFARDPLTQAALAILVSTFVVCLTALRGIRPDEPLPLAVIALVYVLGMASAAALLGFVGHIVRLLRVDTMMVGVHQEAAATIRQTYPPYGDAEKAPPTGIEERSGGPVLAASSSGFVAVIRPEPIVAVARELDVVVRLDVRPGDHVVRGAPLGIVWGDGASEEAIERLDEALEEAVDIGVERTAEQDVAFGLRQLSDIAVKAISPGINDPVTAATSLAHSADLLVRLTDRRLGAQAHADDDGALRLLTPDRDYRYYLDLACAPVRRYGRREPIVLSALLRLLRDCAVAANDDGQRREIERQRDLVLTEMADDLLEEDRRSVLELGERVTDALHGRVEQAYRDRAGETRSF